MTSLFIIWCILQYFGEIYLIKHQRRKCDRRCFCCVFAIKLDVVFIESLTVQFHFSTNSMFFCGYYAQPCRNPVREPSRAGGVPAAILTDKTQGFVKKTTFIIWVFEWNHSLFTVNPQLLKNMCLHICYYLHCFLYFLDHAETNLCQKAVFVSRIVSL